MVDETQEFRQQLHQLVSQYVEHGDVTVEEALDALQIQTECVRTMADENIAGQRNAYTDAGHTDEYER